MFAFSFSKLDPWYIKKEEDFIIKHLDVNGLSHFEVQDMFIDAKSHRLTLVILFRSPTLGHI